ncbi:MAG: hypothetical protein DHS20C01_36650 [marine bacterium B5-7]|nr:MAG: hypothetical protein DHS20C01_36650 [marine bacterium B5-7]
MQQISIKRIYEIASKDDGYRVLVDRMWPRGVSRNDAAIDQWVKEIAPSTELRKWFNHDPEKWDEFQKRYRIELKDHSEALIGLKKICGDGSMTLLYAAKDTEHNQAVVLKQVLETL